jgi:hypothetical protein
VSAGEPVPRLRRDIDPPASNGRRAVILIAIVFLLLVGFVVTLVVTIGLHNNGVRIPPGPQPSATTPH